MTTPEPKSCAIKLADSDTHIIPGHDPQVLKRYRAPAPEREGIVARVDVALLS